MDLAEIIVRRLGIDPVELKAAFQAFLENVAETNREVKAAKAGAQAIWPQLDARLFVIENNLICVMDALGLEPVRPSLTARPSEERERIVNGG